MNQEEPEVARYEIQNALWWVGMTGIDGIRQDTIQYMPRFFIRDLSNALHRQYPKLWMVGEVFERDAAHTAFFIGGHKGWDGIDTKLDSVFDFALWNASLLVFTNKAPVRFLRDQLKYDALYPDASKLTVLANNHDTPRFLSLEGATLRGAMMHVAFILSVRGIPQLYYGEEIGMEGKDDPDNRRDFPVSALQRQTGASRHEQTDVRLDAPGFNCGANSQRCDRDARSISFMTMRVMCLRGSMAMKLDRCDQSSGSSEAGDYSGRSDRIERWCDVEGFDRRNKQSSQQRRSNVESCRADRSCV